MSVLKNLIPAILFIVLVLPVRGVASESKSLTILYQSDFKGAIEGCKCNKTNNDVPRWATMARSFHDEGKNVLFLDCGNAYFDRGPTPEVTADVIIEALNLVRFDVLNIGKGELSLGIDFLRQMEQKAHFPFISANIFLKQGEHPFAKQFVIKECDGIKIGITGVIAPEYVKENKLIQESITVKDPTKILHEIIPEIRKQADVIVLLSHVGAERTRLLVEEVAGIDIAIVGRDRGIGDQIEKIGGTIIVNNCAPRKSISLLKLELTPDGSCANVENSIVDIAAGTVLIDPEAQKLLESYRAKKKDFSRAKAQAAKKTKLDEELQQLSTMSPEEFIKHMQETSRPAQKTGSPPELESTFSD